MTPPWLPRSTTLPGRAVTAHVLRNALQSTPWVGIGGDPGVGKTSLAAVVARTSKRPIVAISLLACTTSDDAVRAIGDALGLPRCGDEGAALDALRLQPDTFFVIDDAANDCVLAPVERILAALPEARALVVSEAQLLPRHIEIGDPSGGASGRTLLARLSEALGLPDAGTAFASLPASVDLLARFPMGVARGALGDLPSAILRPDIRERAILRRGVAAYLPTRTPPSSERVTRSVQALLDLARGAHPSRIPDIRDVLLLRALRLQRPLGDLVRTELAAAESRCLLIAGQAEAAATVLAGDTLNSTQPGHALLSQARTELAFALGDLDSAWVNALSTADALGAAGDASGRATMWRRVAERLAERGEVERADDAWRRARHASRLLGEEGGLAAAMRGAAALALSRGEWVGASALHEEAAESPAPPSERTNLRLGELTLALIRGENASIQRGLDALQANAGDDDLLLANLDRRRADALIRAGDPGAALVAADRAALRYGQLGEGVARGAALRLGADITAMMGRPEQAHTRYERAMREQVRSRDWAGLARSLDHAATFAEHVGNLDRARLLRDQRAGVQRTRGAH